MKKLFIFLATLFAFCLNWAGCSEGGSDNAENEGGGSGNNQSSITLSKGLLEFDSNNGYQTIIVTSSDNWTVTGGADWCDISPSSGSTGMSVSITVDENTSDKDRTATFTFTCGNQSAKLTVTQYGIIETSYVELKLNNDNTELSYNEQTGETVITYSNGSVPQIEQGQSFVLTNDYGYDIRKIVSYSASGNKLTIKTEPGNMCDLFKNISFTLTTNPNMTASARSTGRVITPTSIKVVNGKSLKEVYSRNNSTTTDVYENTNARLKYDYDFGKQVVEEGDFGKIEWTKGIYNIDMDAIFSFDFGEKIINQTKTGELKDFKFYLDGNIDLDFYLDYETGATSAGFEKKDIIKEKVLPSIILEFMVGTIPVVLTLDADLGTQITSTNVEAGTIIQGGFQLNTKAKLGLVYNAQQNVSTISEHDSKFVVNNPAFKIQGLTEAQASVFPHLGFKLYKSQGPWMEFIPSLKMNANGTSETAEYQEAGWNAGINATTETVLGLNLDAGIFGSNSITPINNTLSEDTLFKAPYCILLESPKNMQSIQVNEEVELCFHVQGKDYMSGDSINCPNALIEYGIATTDETNFKASEQIVTDENGRAKIKWTPTNINQCLVAQIIGANREIIDKVEFKPTLEDKRRTLLEMIYKQTNGDNWKNNDNWLTDAPIEEWYGVYVDETGKIDLSLGSNNLNGSINLNKNDNILKNVDTSLLRILSCNDNNISFIDLSGCTSLEELNCYSNPLATLNISGCVSLVNLEITNASELSLLDISGCTAMSTLHIDNCKQLKELNVSNLCSLKQIVCYRNSLTQLNLSGCTALEYLDCMENQLKELDASHLTSLKEVKSDGNNLINLNLAGCIALEKLQCSSIYSSKLNLSNLHSLKELSLWQDDEAGPLDLDISGCTSISNLYDIGGNIRSINASNCTSLYQFRNYDKSLYQLNIKIKIKRLNLSGCTSLNNLYLDGSDYGGIEHIDLQGCTALQAIGIEYTNLSSLDVSDLTSLETLHCDQNKLVNLKVDRCYSLKELWCRNNLLNSLDAATCTSLKILYCEYNKITSEIPEWMLKITNKSYDVRYSYVHEAEDVRVTDWGIGWWYPGEPERGYHYSPDRPN